MPENPTRVCAVITESTVETARVAINQTKGLADLCELRLDYLRDFNFGDIDRLRPILEGRRLPVIITCRAQSEGGVQQIDDVIRLRLLVEGARRYADYCDIEASHYEAATRLAPDLEKLIVSYHNFTETPSNLDEIYNRITMLPAAIHKIVTWANSITDTLSVFDLLERSKSQRRLLIAMAMGERGLLTRVLGPAFGSFLTYGAIQRGRESATGQPTCDELLNLYQIHQVSRHTAVTGIVGNPVSHSASPAMHNAAFAELGLDFVYLPFEVGEINEFFRRLVNPKTGELNWNLKGLSVTIPHKTAVIPMLIEVDDTAKAVGAVNTVVLDQQRMIGYNTDVTGAMVPLERICSLKGENCCVIGSGGAARAVVYGLLERGARVSVFARNRERARKAMQEFAVDVYEIDSLASSKARVLIQTTPVGMRDYAEDTYIIPIEFLKSDKIIYDLVYNPIETRLIKDANTAGCRTINGLDMLVAQAAVQFELWTGKPAPIESMRNAALSKVT